MATGDEDTILQQYRFEPESGEQKPGCEQGRRVPLGKSGSCPGPRLPDSRHTHTPWGSGPRPAHSLRDTQEPSLAGEPQRPSEAPQWEQWELELVQQQHPSTLLSQRLEVSRGLRLNVRHVYAAT
ncbi:unnamed protein product [Pleuronectes platessa]|uniref:Uncharacterized protein n=1 Tax=Pleuronectes platessa TaxID=8262 RepID=A0A9N7YAD2_PLEPL|nr:unnamed protein product [Pleuronectes platessa]